jgi:hypothetical protein
MEEKEAEQLIKHYNGNKSLAMGHAINKVNEYEKLVDFWSEVHLLIDES